MRQFLTALLTSAFLATPATAADPLGGLTGKSRPILLFAKSRSDASLDKQIDLLRERREEVRERQIVVLRTAGREETRAAIGYTDLPRGAALQLRRRFEPQGSGLTVVLVGKDGTEKGRWQRVVDPQELFDLIDSMPMRQRELEEQAGQQGRVVN